MYLLPLLLACQESLRTPSGAHYYDVSEYVQEEVTHNHDFDLHGRDVSLSLYEREVIALINEHREREELEPLRIHNTLVQIVREHSMDMALGILPLGHDGFDERTEEVLDCFDHNTYEIAENVGMAHGVDAAQAAVEMWLESTGHRDNIEGPYTLSGIGSYERDGATYFTQIFLNIN